MKEHKESEPLIEILNTILKGSPLNSFKKLLGLTIEAHLYIDQWKKLDISISTLEKVIDIVRRFEENGLQLEGKGVWLLLMCLKYCYNPAENEKLSKESQISLVETLLRITLEHAVHLDCIEILQYILDRMELTATDMFEAGISIADQFPNVIACDNFAVMLRFSVNCVDRDSRCFLQAMRFLSTVVERVDYDYKANYFVCNLCKVLVKAFDSEYLSTAGIKNVKDIQSNTLLFLTQLVSLHPLHPQQLMTTSIPHSVIGLLTATKSNSPGSDEDASLFLHTTATACQFITALCHDPIVCSQLKALVPMYLLSSHIVATKDTAVLEAVAGLFLVLNSQEFDYLYPGRPARDKRTEVVQFLKTLLEAALEATNEALAHYHTVHQQAIASGKVNSARRLSLDKPLSTSERRHSGSHAPPPPLVTHSSNSLDGDNTSSSSKTGDEDLCLSVSVFEPLIRILERVDHHLKLNQVNELFPVVDAILHLLLLQLQDFKTFELLHLNIVDTVILLLAKKERCWWAAKEDPLDTDFQNMSADLVTQFSRVTANNKLFDTNDMKTLNYLAGTEDGSGVKRTISKRISLSNCSTPTGNGLSLTDPSTPPSSSVLRAMATAAYKLPTSEQEASPPPTEAEMALTRAQEESAMEHLTANMKHCTTQFVGQILFLKNFLSTWEAEDIEVTCRKLMLVYCIVGINGTATLQPLLAVKQLEDVLWELLNETRLGLGAYPQMQRKCIQLLTLIALDSTGESSGLSNINDIAEYVLKILVTKEENRHDLSLMYSCLSCVLALADRERTVRRKVITYFGRIYEVFEALDPVDSLSPLLHLAGEMLEYLTKLELDGEQCLVTLILRSLLTRNKKVRVHACDLICAIGGASPGIIHRGIGRREIEDVLVSMLLNENIAHNPAMVLSVLKACNVFVHDVNLKPFWIPNPWAYHWSDYKSDLSSRPMLNYPFVDVLLNVMHRAPPSYRMIYFSICLSIASSLMYNCSDGIVNPSNKQDVANLALLKDSLVANILPWLPIAVDFITIGKKNIGVNKPPTPREVNNSRHKRGSLGKMLDSTKKQLDQIAANLVKKQMTGRDSSTDKALVHDAELALESSNQTQHDTTKNGIASSSGTNNKPNRFRFLGVGGGKQDKETKEGTANPAVSAPSSSIATVAPTVTTTPPASTTLSVTAPVSTSTEDTISSHSPKGSNHSMSSLPTDHEDDEEESGKRNLSMEFLTEKTVDGLYSFLCMDEMFPLSTYLRNVNMFQRTPVIACVSYFMTENKTNLTIQRRGIDFIKYFTDNQIGLSSIAMHSPSALISAARALHDVLDVQYSFCKIITAVSQSDDFARDNLIRFQVHVLLMEIILKQHPEQSRLACMAVTELASNDQNVISMCQSSGLVESIVALLDGVSTDLKVQVEGLRALCAINQVPEFLIHSKKASTFAILKRTKKFLLNALKIDKIDTYDRQDLEDLLSDALWNNEKCTIS